ncbi:MAG: EamA family transporter [Chloroflexales bacterium]
MQKIDEIAALPSTAVITPEGKISMSMNTVVLICLATVLGIGGQFMLKYGMGQMGPLSLSVGSIPQIIWQIATAPYVVGGLLIYGVGTFFWLITLSRIELSVAYPFVSLNQVLIFLIAWLVLHEQISPQRGIGVAVICAGMLLVAQS